MSANVSNVTKIDLSRGYWQIAMVLKEVHGFLVPLWELSLGTLKFWVIGVACDLYKTYEKSEMGSTGLYLMSCRDVVVLYNSWLTLGGYNLFKLSENLN